MNVSYERQKELGDEGNKLTERKKIDAETRAAALELAREYRDRALMDREYFLNGYAGDMELEHIYAEVKKRLG